MYPSSSPPPPEYSPQPTSHFDNMRSTLQNLSLHGHRPHFHRSSQGELVAGPLLRYIGTNYEKNTYIASCLLVSTHKHAPPLEITLRPASASEEKTHSHFSHHFRHSNQQTYRLYGEALDVFRQEYTFWRYGIELPLMNEPQIATYSSECFTTNTAIAQHATNSESASFEFHLPSLQQSMRFMFYSCNGFSDIPQEMKDKFGEKEAPLWQDVLDRHEVLPFHVFLGGGDQLYQDRLLKDDFMKPWRDEKDPKKRVAMTLTQSMRDGFEHFYFWNYVINFGFKDNPVVAKAFATIPSVNMWDDHDIIDGYGSYPADMQNADCFRVLFLNATRFYYLFQHHTTPELATHHGMIRGTMSSCHHILTTLGRDIALLSLDARGERTKHDVCQPKSYDILFDAIYRQIPATVKHLLVLTGVPLVYPRLTLFEKAMDGAAGFNLATIAGKTGALGDIINGQLNKWNGDPELLDDMNDHWTASNHEVERKRFIERLQQYARERSVRVSFLGGDVHCCGAGRLYSKDMKQKEEGDPHLMVQIISSAIVNIPPPQALLTILNQNSSYVTFSPNVEEKMYNLFKRSPNGNTRQNKKLMGCRNYCAGYVDEETGKIFFWIQAEKEVGKKGTMGYGIEVPRLIFGPSGKRHLQPAPSTTWMQPVSNEPPLPQRPQQQQQQQQQQQSSLQNRPVPPPPLPSRTPGGFVRPPSQ
ncbi:uncharacterized protein BX664DRAFT_337477 [Halteromyces radiatus]|uniref:uncharacterized protein n=1 Tax=Halteromyces radiatus TaxID=101107 RepID=UPI00221F605E|nr:uncharacterized protein BX664DRAFT_337477 [Halteromyces radiatus]KAI8084645.1 hypothetical protein BX664DRAFT_337477 [Halteromyces radiatus]